MVSDALLKQLLHEVFRRTLSFVVSLLKRLTLDIHALYLLVQDCQDLALVGSLHRIRVKEGYISEGLLFGTQLVVHLLQARVLSHLVLILLGKVTHLVVKTDVLLYQSLPS